MSYVCPKCQRESHHPTDELAGWCAACEAFTRDEPARTRQIAYEVEQSGDLQLAQAIRHRLDPFHVHPWVAW